MHLFVLLTHVGRYDEARVLVRRHGLGRHIERNAAMDSAMLAVIDAHDNPRRATDAQAALSRAAVAVRDGEDRRAIALMYALLRDSEGTIAALRKCLESDTALPLLVRSRLFEHVFDDNRYRALLLAAGDALMT
ncbi:MAG TPA: hypothetical protein VMN60_07620 [Longimicrobiales bacterium]|nr:hypothetical protein [Longimicrobiales bacterium]